MPLLAPWRCWRAAGPGASAPLLALAALVILGAAAAAAEDGLVVQDAWMRAIIPSRPAAGYFTLSNQGAKAATLVGADSPDCGMLMLHRSLHQGGEERMEMVESVSVPAHGSVKFSPGGFHLMCTSPSPAVKAGGSVPVTLHFADGAMVTTHFPVRGATGK